jgi:hypothetical protein
MFSNSYFVYISSYRVSYMSFQSFVQHLTLHVFSIICSTPHSPRIQANFFNIVWPFKLQIYLLPNASITYLCPINFLEQYRIKPQLLTRGSLSVCKCIGFTIGKKMLFYISWLQWKSLCLKSFVFWNIISFIPLKISWCFGGKFSFDLQGSEGGQSERRADIPICEPIF